VNTSGWRVPQNIQLADPFFFKPQKLLSLGQIKQRPEFFILQKTVLRCIVSGRCYSEKIRYRKIGTADGQVEVLESIDTTLQKFWSVEDFPPKAKLHTPEHQLCEQHLRKVLKDFRPGHFRSVCLSNLTQTLLLYHMKLRRVEF